MVQLTVLSADTIATKWDRADKAITEAQASYEELTERLDRSWIDEWTEQEKVAMQNRGDALKIYVVSSEKGWPLLICLNTLQLTWISSNTSRYKVETFRERGSPGESVRNCFHTHRGSFHRTCSVSSIYGTMTGI